MSTGWCGRALGAIKRAGADLILTYFAMDIARQGFDLGGFDLQGF